jgi:hypothetical protein
MLLKLGHDRFLPNPFQFIIYLSPFHSTLYIHIYWKTSLNKQQLISVYKRVKIAEFGDANSKQFKFTVLRGSFGLYISEPTVSISYTLS